MPKQEFETVAKAVLDDLSIIHGWATLYLLDNRWPVTVREPMQIIQTTARRSAHRLRDSLQSSDTERHETHC